VTICRLHFHQDNIPFNGQLLLLWQLHVLFSLFGLGTSFEIFLLCEETILAMLKLLCTNNQDIIFDFKNPIHAILK